MNSWMQTPAGFSINAAGQFVPEDWWAVIFNPSFPYRFVHMVLAAYLTTAFVVGGIGAWHLLKDRASRGARVMFSMAMWMAALVAPIQIFAGDLHGLNTLEYQPAKIAAMEGHYETHVGAPLILFGIPDDEAEVTRYQIAIPKLGSLILTHHLDGEVKGLKAFPKDQRPPAEIVFWSFRLMVGIGFAMLGIGLWSLLRRLQKNRLYEDRWLHRVGTAHGAIGIRGRARRLDHNRSRPPALHRLRPAHHGSVRLAHRRPRRGHVTGGLHHRLFLRLRGRDVLHPPPLRKIAGQC